jgi:modulator of FtsH protease HflC
MKKHIGMVVLAVLVLLLLVVYTVAFQVSQLTDLVVVTTFGKTTEVLSGRDANQAGLHFKALYPIQEEVRYDARTFLFEDVLDQTLTKDSKSLVVSVFCAWRIEDANRFLSSVRSVPPAQDRIRDAIRSAKTNAFKKWDLADLINTDRDKMKLSDVEQQIEASVSPRLEADYGVKIVMVGVKRLGLDKDVSNVAIDTMKADRQAMARVYEVEGQARAIAIRERARAASEKIRTFAERKAQEIRGEGDRAAAAYYGKFQGHEDLAIFLRQLDALRKALSSRAVLILDESTNPLIKLLRTPPTKESIRSAITTQPAGPASAGGTSK